MKRIVTSIIICALANFAFSQNFGIDNPNPLTKLHVQGVHTTTQVRLTLPAANNGAGTGDVNLQLWVSEPNVSWDAGGVGMNVTNDGNSPAGFGRLNTGLGQSYIRFIPNGGAMAFNTTNNAGTYYQTMYMTNGNIGIGTTSPGAKLHISAGDASLALFGPNAIWGGKLYVGASPDLAVAQTAQVISTDGNLHLDPAPSKNMYLGFYQPRDIFINPSGGNVGVGTTSPADKLHVNGSMRATVYYDADNTSYFTNPFGYSNFNQLNISRDGAGECCSGGDYTLSIAENTSTTGRTATIQFHNGGVSEGYLRLANGGCNPNRRIQFGDYQGCLMGIEASGRVAAQSFLTTSDGRLKENIQIIDGALAMINTLRGVRYNWKKETPYYKGGLTGSEVGVIAQEIEPVLPEAVSEVDGDGGSYKAVAYGKFVPVLIEAIKEQQQIIEKQQQTIIKFEQRIKALESK